MWFMKLWYHIIARINYVFYKCLYRSKLTVGKHTTWRRHFSIMIYKDAQIEIGSDCFFNNDCSIVANGTIKIGNGCLFGENVKIYDHNHRFREKKPIKDQGLSTGKITIGNNCWIGSNVTIIKGATIGDGCVIGAGNVICGKIENDMIIRRNNGSYSEKIRGRE